MSRPRPGRSGRRLDAMQVTETLNEGLKHEFKVNVPASDLDAKADARLVDLKDKVRLNGFRPGKVPVSHLKKVYGRSVMAETIDQTIRVTINFKGTIDGVPFDGGTGENIQVTIGSNTFIPGFEEQLIGIAAGETRTLKVSFPKNYASEKLAGQPAEFETMATLIEGPQDTAVNDEFAKTLGLESLDKLKQAARERLVAEFAGATRQRVKRTLLDRLDESHRFDAPPSLVEEEFNLMWTSIKAEMESSGKTFADEHT